MQAPSTRSRRGIATVGLVVLTCILVVLSSFAMWLRALVLNTDSYVKAVAPVLDRSDVRDALAASIVAQLYAHVDVATVLRDALPKDAKTFAPTLAASIRETSEKLAATALGTAAVKKVWRESNRVAHDQLVHVLEGKGKVVSTNNGEIALDTGELARSVRHSLADAGIHVFDHVPVDSLSARFVIFKSEDLLHAQQATTLLNGLGIWLPIATVVCGAGAIACSRHRRRTVEILALAIAGVMVLIVVGAAVGRSVYLGHIGDVVAPAVAAALFDALVRPLRTGVRVVFVGAVLVWAVAWLSGSRAAIEHEEHVRTIVFDWTRRYARPLAIGGVVTAALVLVAWDRPRPLVVGSILLQLALWEGVILLSERAVRKTG